MAKRRARQSAARHDDDVVTAERRQHGAVECLDKQIPDAAGAIGRPFAVVDTLEVMQRRGSITAGMRAAGERFRRDFRSAALDPLRAANLTRIPGSTGGDMTERGVAAKEHVWRAVCAVGGLASAGGACVWHVVGLEATLKEWALSRGWAGRPIREEIASGILIGALGVLEEHYGR